MGKIAAVARLWLVVTAVAVSSPAFISCHVKPRTVLHRLSSSSSFLTRTDIWFNQTLDHFSPYVKIAFLCYVLIRFQLALSQLMRMLNLTRDN